MQFARGHVVFALACFLVPGLSACVVEMSPVSTPTPLPTPTPTLRQTYLGEVEGLLRTHADTEDQMTQAIIAAKKEEILSPPQSPGGSNPMMTLLLPPREAATYAQRNMVPQKLKDALLPAIESLEQGISQIDSHIIVWERITPPPEARYYHDAILLYFKTQRASREQWLLHFKGIMSRGKLPESEAALEATLLSVKDSETRVALLHAPTGFMEFTLQQEASK